MKLMDWLAWLVCFDATQLVETRFEGSLLFRTQMIYSLLVYRNHAIPPCGRGTQARGQVNDRR